MPKVKKTQRQPTSKEIVESFDPADADALLRLRSDPVLFCRLLGFTPNKAQVRLLRADLHEQKTLLPWGRGGGKTEGMSYKIPFDCLRFRDFKVYIFSPSADQSKELFDRIPTHLSRCEFPLIRNSFEEAGNTIYFGGDEWGSFVKVLLVGLDASRARGKHVHFGYLVGDEINSHHDARLIHDVLLPSVGTGGGIVYMSSPGEIDESNFMYRTFLDWRELEKEEKARGEKPRHCVMNWTYKDSHHLSRQAALDALREYKRQGRLWFFKREWLGRFTRSAGQFFNAADVQSCHVRDQLSGARGDTWIYSIDPGLDRSPAVILISRWNPIRRRLEITELISVVRESNKYVDSEAGHARVRDYTDLLDLILRLRQERPISRLYYDPGCEQTIAETLANSHQVPIVPCRIGGYAAKLTALRDLERSLAARRIIWADSRITNQLLRFAPIVKSNGEYEFPDKDYDIIAALTQLNRYLGDRTETPFIVSKHERKVAI